MYEQKLQHIPQEKACQRAAFTQQPAAALCHCQPARVIYRRNPTLEATKDGDEESRTPAHVDLKNTCDDDDDDGQAGCCCLSGLLWKADKLTC